ncbi:uncharacterized protein VSU04_001803 [Chlamydotis macqueenii]
MGGKQKKLISINDNLKHPIQEGGEIRSYECSLVYESKVERKTDVKLTGHSLKLLKINRLEEINTRYNSNRLEKTTFFQSVEKMERTRRFQEEKFSELDPGTEDEKEFLSGILNWGLIVLLMLIKGKPRLSFERSQLGLLGW